MEKAPRPPPPVYQPEILGEAVYLAATSDRREWRVTGSSLAFSFGNKLAPSFLDWMAGLVGVFAQQTTRDRVVAARDPNTFQASTKASGTHGPFDGESLARSVQWSFNKMGAPVRFGAALIAIAAYFVLRPRRR